MHPQLPALIELQTIDLRIAELHERDRKIPLLAATAEATLDTAKRELHSLTVTLESLSKERRDYERDLESHEGQLDKVRGRLRELKTNKEYQAHLFEIEMGNKKKGELEERILTLMERIETYQEQARQAKNRMAEAEQSFLAEKARLDAQATSLRQELSELSEKRQSIEAGMDRAVLSHYNKVRARRKDVAVAPVRNGICSGCRLQLPPQLVAQVRRSDALLNCPYCYRMLYWEGEPVSLSPSANHHD